MDQRVFVSPLEILHCIYLDLAESGVIGGGYMVKHLPMDDSSNLAQKISITLNFPTSLSPSGQICVDVSAQWKPGSDAIRSVLTRLLQTLRKEYKIFHSDYSYAAISERRALYDEMESSLEVFSKAFWELDSAFEDLYNAVFGCYGGLSLWLSSGRVGTTVSTMELVGALHGWLSATAGSIKRIKATENSIVEDIMSNDLPAESMSSIKSTTTMPMKVNWEASCHVFQLLFETCLRKIGAEASIIDIIPLGQGSYQGCIHVSFEPHEFLGEPAPCVRAAKAKVLYSVLRHIDSVLGFQIVDVNHSASQHINCQIEKFDQKMEGIWQSGMRLEEVAVSCQADFYKKSSLPIIRDSCNPTEEMLLNTIDSCASDIEKAMSKLQNALMNFIPKKVHKAMLELYLGRNI